MSEEQGSRGNEKENKSGDSPKKGRTLSTSTSSFEALDPHDPNISLLANTMFTKCYDFLSGNILHILCYS
ncbi:hypothetical protein RUM43_013183 [Polyplax serrata]|uniref:Uncharacterized protein n=1 Tax=Polyplax serrata TaxID=468196 RepID=A0AAN8NK32_POLSC